RSRPVDLQSRLRRRWRLHRPEIPAARYTRPHLARHPGRDGARVGRVRAPALVIRRAARNSVGLGVSLLLVAAAGGQSTPALGRAEVIRRYAAPEARQAVAVDATSFYAITNREIG